MATGEELRRAMGKFTTGVALITTLEEDGTVHAMTANAVASICLEPALVLVSVGWGRNTHRYIHQRGRFAINVLARHQSDAASYFAKDEQERQDTVPVRYRFNGRGTPAVVGCISFLDCEVVASHDYGDHTIFVGEVKETEIAEGDPLVFYQGRLVGLHEGSAQA